ncbi:LysR family transcriptional regulator [Aliigemmobacter aestuarii]|uniref:LysR family transcriptional regulator n=1 Tax=Aliigemmobacter aestuarii TaxID=1445661 RepID=A0A4S3MKE5_9RHOB|nr:LysR family transcriptional regulator [Gemmobacter aestuarii]THD82436.1 LysR family transcriptional regulator [Gemmobacter aestuarii]
MPKVDMVGPCRRFGDAMEQFQRNPGLLRSLQHLDAFARRGTLAEAAGELGVSVSAVSHQLNELATFVGEPLVVKTGRRLTLTDTGRLLAQDVSQVLRLLDASLNTAVGKGRHALRIAVCSAFGPFWLVPRLSQFRTAYPDVDVELTMYTRDPESIETGFDVAITTATLAGGVTALPLHEETLVAVASPTAVASAGDAGFVLITTDTQVTAPGAEWIRFDAMSGGMLVAKKRGDWLFCSHYILALESARAGLGAALLPDFMARDALADGSLVQIHPASVLAGRTYRLYFKSARKQEHPIRLFSRWIRGQKS